MMTEREFNLLYAIKKNGVLSYRSLCKLSGLSLGSVASTMKDFEDRGLINKDGITELGIACLSPYKVKNAIILAAGMSTRFVPLSYDMPKGLLEVKGEVLIERQIKQLKEAGIADIILVLGYKKELFFYLAEKYDLKIIINPLYNVKNNIESLYLASANLSNTYICASDNYFVNNIYEEYVYDSFFSVVPTKLDLDECYAISKDNDIIRKIVKGSKNGGDMIIGSAYFDKEFSSKFISIMEEVRPTKEYDSEFFETLIADKLKVLPPIKKKVFIDTIFEFDSLDELRKFDDKYINDVDSKILKNISNYFKCNIGDIVGLSLIKEGLTNTSFVFEIKGKKYVYRHPGEGTQDIINRKHERIALKLAKENGIDPTYLYQNDKEGWKISSFIPDCRCPSYSNQEDVILIINKMKELHKLNLHVDWIFDPYKESLRLEKLVKRKGEIKMPDFEQLKQRMTLLNKKYSDDPHFSKRLCHCDTYAPNWMIKPNDEVILIDWEYSGESDPCVDLGYFVVDGEYSVEDAKKIFELYLGEDKSIDNLRHCFALAAITSYYWFVWALYKETKGSIMGDALYRWYKMAKRYSSPKVEELLNSDKSI